MSQFYYLLNAGQHYQLHARGCVCLEDHPDRQFLGSALTYRHAYQIASQRLNVWASICRLCIDDSMSDTRDSTLTLHAR